MTHDPTHPFHSLAKALAARKQADKAEPAPASPARATRKPGRGKEEAPSDEEEAALFMDAVSRIKPLPGKAGKRKTTELSLGEALAVQLQENQAGGAAAFGWEKGPAAAPGAPSADINGARKAFGFPGALPAAAQPEAAARRSMRDGVPPSGGSRDGGLRDGEQDRQFGAAMRDLFTDSPDPHPDAEEDVLFAKAMQGVTPVNGKGRDVAVPAGGEKRQPALDPAKALRDVLEGRVEFALHHTDEFMEGFVVGVDPLVLARLRAGQYSPEKHLDLHGMNARQAYDALTWFIKEAYQRGLRTVVVVTGRGRNSPDGVGVLRPLLQRWLSREPFKRVVLAFCTAKPCDGGPGAAYVLLRKYKKSRGKIVWDHTPSDDEFPDI